MTNKEKKLERLKTKFLHGADGLMTFLFDEKDLSVEDAIKEMTNMMESSGWSVDDYQPDWEDE